MQKIEWKRLKAIREAITRGMSSQVERVSSLFKYSYNFYLYIGKEFVKEVSSLEMNLFKIFNLISSNDINNAIKEIELLSEEIELCNDYNIYSYAIYLKGKIEIHLENEKSAISYFQEIIDNQK